MTTTRRAVLAAGSLLAMPAIVRAQGVIEVSFLFPVAVGGPITKIIDGYAAAFEKDNPDVKVKPIYAGSYTDTLTKALTSMKGGDPAHLAVLLAVDAFTLIDQDAIVPFDTLATGAQDQAWLKSFYPAFLANGTIDGHCWGIPFQRSTIVLYWNKDAFRSAGLDPEVAPATWQQQHDFAQKVTQRSGSDTQRWGIALPSTGFTYWMYQALAIQAGAVLADPAGKSVSFTTPGAEKALQYWLDLAKDGVHPPGIVEWGTTPRDFLEGRVAMIWHTTGNLSNIRGAAKFPFGVAMLPADARRGSPTGGGNFHIFKSASEAQRRTALRFVQWATSPERAAQWGIDTGYVAVRPDAWATPAMQNYVADFPQATVARDQLQYAVEEFSTHDNQRVTKALSDQLQSALTGAKTAPAALLEAQRQADRLLKPYL